MAYSSYPVDERMEQDLFQRIRKLEMRMSLLDSYRSPSPVRKTDRIVPKLEVKQADMDVQQGPDSVSGLKQIISSLANRFEDKMKQMELRIARVERELNLVGGTNSPTDNTSLSQLGADVRLLKGQLKHLDQNVLALNTQWDERYEHLLKETENTITRLKLDLEKKMKEMSNRVCEERERAPQSKSNTEVIQSHVHVMEERMRTMISASQTKLDERLQALSIEVKTLETEVYEQRAKMVMEPTSFRNLISEVTQDNPTKFGMNDARVSQARGLRVCSAERRSITQQGIVEKMEALRFKMKAEMGILRVQQQDDLQKLMQRLIEMESKMNTMNQGSGEQKMEFESVLAAEIKTRRLNEGQLIKRIKVIEDRIEALSRMLNDSMTQMNRLPTPVYETKPAPGEGQMNAVKDLYRHVEKTSVDLRRQYAELNREILNERESLNKLKEALQKMIDFRITELKDQFSLLHNEIIQLQIRSIKEGTTDTEPVEKSGAQPLEIRKLAESLFAIKLALLMKIRMLEKRENQEHEAIRGELQKLTTMTETFS